MIKQEIINVEKGEVSKPSLTKAIWRHKLETATYTQPYKFEVWWKYLKGFVFDFFDGSKMDDYLALTKEVANYIGRKFDYGAYIQRSLENDLKTSIPVTSRPIGVEADGSLPGDQKFIWVNNKIYYL